MSKMGKSVDELKADVARLKKTAGIASVIAVICGGGGLFGIIKWMDGERALIDSQTRLNNAQVVFQKVETLLPILDEQIKEARAVQDLPNVPTDIKEKTKRIETRLIETKEKVIEESYTVERQVDESEYQTQTIEI